MKKWYRPEVAAQRDDILKRFYGFEEAQHHVYAVVAHIRGEKLPIYVGETARPRKRFKQHLAVAWGGREVDNKAGKWERELVRRGGKLEFHGLEGTTDRVRGLALESAWTRALRRHGCSLANTWPEHRKEARGCLVPNARIGTLSVREAIDAEIPFGITCRTCRTHIELPHAELLKLKLRNPKISALAGGTICAFCGGEQKLWIFPDQGALAHRKLVPDRAEKARAFLSSIGATPPEH